METIRKQLDGFRVRPNLIDYDSARTGFSWEAERRSLDGLPGGGGLNIAHEAVDRHAAGPRSDRIALRWLGRDDATRDITSAALRDATSRFANVLAGLDVHAGERVFALAGRIPALYVAL
ncbi:MAG: acetate--CoA ligase, partial [Burkholderiaceae bacterium]|nr:acetate--CoA ligase [Burkholderiaceae bacterium]